mmetsp:Transcript_47726/g.102304  ORF Transcript_47726/g.102304 Transcript_47726/m.102304 type:complete len:454 (+) Transcript_47726:93-1454(+)
MGCCQSSSAVAVKGNDEVKQESLVESYVASMNEQFRKAIGDPDKLEDTALSKRSPFKMARDNSKHNIDVNLGSTAVARCDMSTDFGQRFAKVIDQLQDLAWERLGMANCKRQTTPHMSIGSVVLDRHSPEAYNEAVREHSGQLAKVKAYLDGADPPARARIQALKINPDGCVTFQLEHDPRQDVIMTDDELVTALRKVPTCSTEEALAGEKKKFAACGDGSFKVTRFQQIRLALGALSCDIKGFYPAGHMVLCNLINAKALAEIPEEQLSDCWRQCMTIWKPLADTWFDLRQIVVLVYVERSLNEGSVVAVPAPGQPLEGYPPGAARPGCFKADANGDVFIDVDKYNERMADHVKAMYLAYRGEVRAMAENARAGDDEIHPDAIAHAFLRSISVSKFKTDDDSAACIQKHARRCHAQKRVEGLRAAKQDISAVRIEVSDETSKGRQHWFSVFC